MSRIASYASSVFLQIEVLNVLRKQNLNLKWHFVCFSQL